MSCDHFPHGLSWIKRPIETLGITMAVSQWDNVNQNSELRNSFIDPEFYN